MKKSFQHIRVIILLLGAFFISAPAFALGLNQAKVAKLSGIAMFKSAGESVWRPLEKATVVSEGDSIKTESGSEVTMELKGAKKTAEIVVREKSEFVFKTFQHDEESKVDTTLLDVSLGAVLVKAEKLTGSSKFEVKTPTSIVGIRGTTFEVRVAG